MNQNEMFRVPLTSVEIQTRVIMQDNVLIGQSKVVERNRHGFAVKSGEWENSGCTLFCEKEVSTAIWYKPSTWGKKKTIKAPFPDYLLDHITENPPRDWRAMYQIRNL